MKQDPASTEGLEKFDHISKTATMLSSDSKMPVKTNDRLSGLSLDSVALVK